MNGEVTKKMLVEIFYGLGLVFFTYLNLCTFFRRPLVTYIFKKDSMNVISISLFGLDMVLKIIAIQLPLQILLVALACHIPVFVKSEKNILIHTFKSAFLQLFSL